VTPLFTARALIDGNRVEDVAALIEDVRHLLMAIDRGYFTDNLLPKSAFIDPLRRWSTPSVAKVTVQ
jgi:hypothetical protein